MAAPRSAAMQDDDPHSLTDILDRLEGAAEAKNDVSVAEIVDTFGSRTYGPFLIVPALIELSPVGAVPGVPTVIALLVVLIAAQILLGRRRIWLPDMVGRRRLSGDKLTRGAGKLRPLARGTDRWLHDRLRFLTRGPFIRFAALACIALALTVPMLEIVPFASSAPMAAIAMFGLALLVRDGVLMILACVLAAGAIAALFWLVPL